MSNQSNSDGDPPASLDDPDWVDRIVAKAMESAEKSAETSDGASSPPVPAPAPAPAPRPRPKPRPAASPAEATVPQRRTRPDEGPVRRRPEPEARSLATASGVAVAGQRPSSVYDEPDANLDVPLPIEPDEDDDGRAARNRALIEWIAVIVGAIAVAFLVKTFLIQAFYIPSSSMEPTLQINDRVLVNKLSYDFGDVNRGDLVVFERPENLVSNTDDLIKRVIGLPGETIELIDGRVFVTGQGLSEPYVGDVPTNWLGFDETARELCGGDEICTIPDGYYFVMGDNRTGSTDSRRFGPIEEEAIVGRAFLRIWPLNDIGWL
jgi:signal peptidase I